MLARMWSNRNSFIAVTVTMEDSAAVSYEMKHTLTV